MKKQNKTPGSKINTQKKVQNASIRKDLADQTLNGKTVKMGLDVHADRYVVVRQIDGGNPQPGQSFSPEKFLEWVEKHVEQGAKVYTCYEAGPFGYGLHRKLTAFGTTNYVIRPRDWDEYGQKVKTDRRDAKQMVLCLDRYVAGNHDAFCVVRVPSEAEEQRRSVSRQRESLQKEKQRLAAQGRSHGLYYGCRIQGQWWKSPAWKQWQQRLPMHLVELLSPLQRLIVAVEVELKAATERVTAAAPEELPAGLGNLTYEILEREVVDWHRFKNRRQVASYTGLCPREDTSDQRRFQGSINKHGNRRLRPVLVECAWRLFVWQPKYRAVAKWRSKLTDPKTSPGRRKQMAVAVARQFAVDWWRVRTGRCQAKDLGLAVPQVPAPAPARKPAAVGSKKQNH